MFQKSLKSLKFIHKGDTVALHGPMFYIVFMSSETMLGVRKSLSSNITVFPFSVSMTEAIGNDGCMHA